MAALPIILLLFFGFAAPLRAARPAADPGRFRELVLPRIEGACRAELGAGNGIELAPKITVEWDKREVGYRLAYERRIDYDPAGRLSLIEAWRIPRERLEEFLGQWGNADPPDWEQLTGEIPGGFAVASRKGQSLMIIREGDRAADLWDLPPYALEILGPLEPPAETGEKQDSGVERGLKKAGRAIRQLVSEIVIDELTDIRGVPITVSTKATFNFNIGDLTPRIRLQRRLRMEDDDTFTVVDSFEGELGLLLGNLGVSSTTGVTVEGRRKVVIFRGGYTSWYRALFAKPFDPRKLPWSVEKLRELPPGVRVVFPAATGAFIGETRVVHEFTDYLPLKETFNMGLRGTFFLSMARDFDDQLELRFGGRVERVAYIQFRSRFDDRFWYDWRRLLGSFLKLRADHIRGARLFYQRKIDLNDDTQAADVISALKQGLRVSGYRLGGAAVGDFFFFFRQVDTRALDTVITRKLPDFQWDHRVESKYLSHYLYGKVDLKLASISRSISSMNDRWKLTSPLTGESVSGFSGRHYYGKNERFLINRDRYHIQVNYFSSRGRNDAFPLTDFIEVYVRRKETRTTRGELQAMFKRTGRSLGQDILDEAGFPGVLPDRDSYDRFEYRWHLILRDEALDTLAERVLGAGDHAPGSLTRKLALRHPYRFWSVRRAEEKGEDLLNSKLAGFVMSAMRWNEPVQFLFSDYPSDSYLFDWSIAARGLPNIGGFCGRTSVPEEMRWAWKAWEELANFDDLFESLDLFE
jgi:hypothetical protein